MNRSVIRSRLFLGGFCCLSLLRSRASAFVSPPSARLDFRSSTPSSALRVSTSDDVETTTTTKTPFFADAAGAVDGDGSTTQTRKLGSQELLMLPRQYSIHLNKPGSEPFPQMNHVCVAVLSATPPADSLLSAVEDALRAHPLLRSHVEGTGEPDKRIDLFRMVREGNPDPETFVSPPADDWDAIGFTARDVLTVVDVDGGSDALQSSWEAKFRQDLDDGRWCDTYNGPLWKLELHRSAGGSADGPCALVLSFNHAISDQSSANLVLDQLLSDVADIDEKNSVRAPAVKSTMPLSLEESVLGVGRSFEDAKVQGFSLDTIKYVAGKAAEVSFLYLFLLICNIVLCAFF